NSGEFGYGGVTADLEPALREHLAVVVGPQFRRHQGVEVVAEATPRAVAEQAGHAARVGGAVIFLHVGHLVAVLDERQGGVAPVLPAAAGLRPGDVGGELG